LQDPPRKCRRVDANPHFFGRSQVDIFTKSNRKSIDDRQVDTLIGLSKGLLADVKLDPSEADFLRTWLAQNRHISSHPVIIHLYRRIDAMLVDDVLDVEESQELFRTLQQIAGEPTKFGEVGKSATLPICKPAPTVSFPSQTFLFTGTCVFGTRKDCQAATERLGGSCANGVT
jgi:hypothetical protein